MENLIIYNLKVAFILTVLWICYSLLFSREKYFSTNRLFLLSALIFSFLLPLFRFKSFSENSISIIEYEEAAREVIIYASGNVAKSHFDLPLVSVVYLAGVSIFLILFLFKLTHILLKIKKANYIKNDGIYIYMDSESDNSFSFFNKIHIGNKNLSEEEISAIEIHERTHVEKKHTFDILLFELAKIIQWFNPAIYFLRKQIAVNHEYTADENTKQQYSLKKYMELMAKSIIGAPLYPVNSFFNKSLLRKRFDMLTKEKTKTGRLKYLQVFPILAVLFIFISCNSENEAFDDALSIKEIISGRDVGSDNIGAQFPGGLYNYTESNLKTPDGAENVNAKLHFDVVIDETGKLIAAEYKNSKFINTSDKIKYLDDFKKSAEDMLLNMPLWNPAKLEGKSIKFVTTAGVIFGGIKNWKDLNPPDLVTKTTKEGEITTERKEKDFAEVKHLYYNDLMMHITKHITYPTKAQLEGVGANVILQITLDKEGKIRKSEVTEIKYTGTKDSEVMEIKSDSNSNINDTYGFAEEALKVVNSIEKLTPATDKDDEPVAITFNLPVIFKLN